MKSLAARSFRAAFLFAGIAGRVASMAKSDTLGVLFARCPSRGTQSGDERRDPGFSLLGLGRGLLCARGTLVRLSLEQKSGSTTRAFRPLNPRQPSLPTLDKQRC